MLRAFALFIFSINLCFAGGMGDVKKVPPVRFYFGGMGGYASTTWKGLVPAEESQNPALALSTPIEAKEGGSSWGVLAGVELSPYFAVEGNYMRYPDAIVYFDELSLFTFQNDGQTMLKTKTDKISFIAKIMLQLPNINARIFSAAGVARIHRRDMLFDDTQFSPTFAVGVNSHVTEHILAEIAGNYTTGYGESNLNPAINYIPFLYSVVFKLSFVV